MLQRTLDETAADTHPGCLPSCPCAERAALVVQIQRHRTMLRFNVLIVPDTTIAHSQGASKALKHSQPFAPSIQHSSSAAAAEASRVLTLCCVDCRSCLAADGGG